MFIIIYPPPLEARPPSWHRCQNYQHPYCRPQVLQSTSQVMCSPPDCVEGPSGRGVGVWYGTRATRSRHSSTLRSRNLRHISYHHMIFSLLHVRNVGPHDCGQMWSILAEIRQTVVCVVVAPWGGYASSHPSHAGVPAPPRCRSVPIRSWSAACARGELKYAILCDMMCDMIFP